MAKWSLKPQRKGVSIEELMKKPLNLYPYKNGRLSVQQKRIRLATICLALIVLSCAVYTVFLGVQNRTYEKQISTMNANLKVEQERLNNQKFLDELLKRIEYKSQLLNFIDQKNTSATLVIETIERNMPMDVKYINLDYLSDTAIRVTCNTSDLEWIAKLVHQLKLENFFNDVFVESIQKVKAQSLTGEITEYEFTLICSFGGTEDETQK